MKRVIYLIILFLLTSATSGSQDLDLREANVTGVKYSKSESQYTFDVTLLHDDDGESPNYADLWVVEDLNGNQLIRRELLHAHGTVEFTRSGSGEIADGITKVVVRGSDQIHGWGGQVALVDLGNNTIFYVNQGSERRDFIMDDFNDIYQTTSTNSTLPAFRSVTGMIFIIIINRISQRNLPE